MVFELLSYLLGNQRIEVVFDKVAFRFPSHRKRLISFSRFKPFDSLSKNKYLSFLLPICNYVSPRLDEMISIINPL